MIQKGLKYKVNNCCMVEVLDIQKRYIEVKMLGSGSIEKLTWNNNFKEV